jgi:putative zinc finger protein
VDRMSFGADICCHAVTETMSAYADGEVSSPSGAAIAAHLADCSSCASLYQRHLQTKRLLSLSDADSWTPPDLRLRIIHAAASRPRRRRRTLWPAGLLASAAMVALVAVFAIGLGPTSFTASPAATPSPQATIADSLSPRPASCSHESGRARARCMGVSLYWLPTVLAEQRYGGAMTGRDDHSVLLSPPLSNGRPSVDLAVHDVTVKGGGNGRISAKGRQGLTPL